jgi:hypothetical protein
VTIEPLSLLTNLFSVINMVRGIGKSFKSWLTEYPDDPLAQAYHQTISYYQSEIEGLDETLRTFLQSEATLTEIARLIQDPSSSPQRWSARGKPDTQNHSFSPYFS